MSGIRRCRIEVRRAKEYFAERLLQHPNVLGVGIGPKIRDGERTEELAVRIYVRRKVPLEELEASDRIPGRVRVPESSVRDRSRPDVPTDVVEVGEVKPVGSGRIRPLVMGFDCARMGPSQYEIGTMGAIVEDQHGRRYLLSNNHVLADLNSAQPHDPVGQPSSAGQQDRVGELARFVPLLPNGENLTDAALAILDPGLDQGTYVEGIGRVVRSVQQIPNESTFVMLAGATVSGSRTGQIMDRESDWVVQYSRFQAFFRNQVLVTIPVAEGDSGALVVTSNRLAVGIVISGGPQLAVCSPMPTTLAQLGDAYLTQTSEDLELRIV